MDAETAKLVLDALDALALALTNHDHEWTEAERSGYEQAIDALLTIRAEAAGKTLALSR